MDPRMIYLLRYSLLAVLCLFSLIILGVSANLISGNTSAGLLIPDFLALDLAIAIITLIIVAVSTSIDFFRRGAFTSMVATEIGWTFILMVLWIAASGDITAFTAGLTCNFVDTNFDGEIIGSDSRLNSGCHEEQVLIAFSWLSFITLLGWHVTLLALAFTAHTRGNPSVWTAPINGTDFFTRKVVVVQPQGQMVYGVPQQPQFAGTPAPQPQFTGEPVQQTYPPAGYNTTPAPSGGAIV